jgi:hypothetical protein
MFIAPRLLALLTKIRAVRRYMFRTVSQTAIRYSHSPLSRGAAGAVHAGDRLPWVKGASAEGDNYKPLRSLGWQLHVYGESTPGVEDICRRRGLPLHVFAWSAAAERAGLTRGALYLVRPDGYIGFVEPNARVAALEDYWEDLVK